ncbi:MAG: NRDE family protein [Smithellaceae bacterium]|nr:NRDE family protein [Smithellaceae bacterium]
MCLLLFSYASHPHYRLILAANRDEFYVRPTAGAAFWDEAPQILAGRDMQGGGTWLGITRQGRIAALTNYRDPASYREKAPSRGLLVRDYLQGQEAPREYLEEVSARAGDYNGFSLIAGDRKSLWYYSNRGGLGETSPGIHGLCNHLLDTPWPKVDKGKTALARLTEKAGALAPEDIFSFLADDSRPADSLLPDTGVGLAWERTLSPVFITSPSYGTRSSTVILIGWDGQVTFAERTFNGGPALGEVRYQFKLAEEK